MDIVIIPFLYVLKGVLELYKLAVFIYIILGWLETFDIVNRYNRFVYAINNFLFRLVEPALSPLRQMLPSIGGLDFSPLALLFALYFLEVMLIQILKRFPV